MNTAASAIDACLHFLAIQGPKAARSLTPHQPVHFQRGTLDGFRSTSPVHMTYCGRFEPQGGWRTVRDPDPNDACERCLRSIAHEAALG